MTVLKVEYSACGLGSAITAALLLFCASTSIAYAQSPQLTDEHIKALDGMGSMNFERLTSHGKFTGCELTYNFFQKPRANGERLFLISGSIVSLFSEGKNFNFILKAKTAIISPRKGLKKIQPSFAALSLGTSLVSFKTKEFKCNSEGGGICILYVDNTKFELMKQTLDKWFTTGPNIIVAIKGNYLDTHIKLRDILNSSSPEKKQSVKAFRDFYSCLIETAKSMTKYLKNLRIENNKIHTLIINSMQDTLHN